MKIVYCTFSKDFLKAFVNTLKSTTAVCTIIATSIIGTGVFSQVVPLAAVNTQPHQIAVPEQGVEPQHLWQNEPFSDKHQSTELISLRDANTKHFRNPDGSITAHITAGLIHYQENGQWKTIFHTISPTENGFENTYNNHKTYYPATSTGHIKTVLPNGASLIDMKDMRMYYEVNGQVVQSQNISNKQGMVNFSKLTYSNVYGNGINLQLTQNTT